MRVPGAVMLAFLAVVPLAAQYRSVGGFGNVAFPGLGHAPTTSNPWGNVAFPGVPGGAAALTGAIPGRGYGGLVPGFRFHNDGGRGFRHNRTSGIYAFPVYVGGYGYDQPEQLPPSEPPAPAPAQPPVVINQYFGVPPPDQEPPPEAAANSNFHFYQAPSNSQPAPSEAAPTDVSYYLIAFKDHTIYSAVAYYTEGDTLHYFTTGNVHNQVSLSLVDRALTEQLNRERNVNVRLP